MGHKKNRLRNTDLKDNGTSLRNINLSGDSQGWTGLPLFSLSWPVSSQCPSERHTRYHFTPTKMAVMKKKKNNICRDWCGDTGPSSVADGDIKWSSLFGQQPGSSSNTSLEFSCDPASPCLDRYSRQLKT